VLFTKALMIWITLIRVVIVIIDPGIGPVAFLGYVGS